MFWLLPSLGKNNQHLNSEVQMSSSSFTSSGCCVSINHSELLRFCFSDTIVISIKVQISYRVRVRFNVDSSICKFSILWQKHNFDKNTCPLINIKHHSTNEWSKTANKDIQIRICNNSKGMRKWKVYWTWNDKVTHSILIELLVLIKRSLAL